VPVLKALLDDADPLVRSEAVRALAQIGDAAAIPALSEKLKDPQAAVRLHAAQGLARLGSKAGAEAAYAALKDADAGIRQQAANTIAAVGDERSGLKALNEAFAAEKDANAKAVIDFARAQLKARLGLKEAAKPAQAAPAKPAKPAKGADKGAGKPALKKKPVPASAPKKP
jgi:HEAT repeat protein